MSSPYQFPLDDSCHRKVDGLCRIRSVEECPTSFCCTLDIYVNSFTAIQTQNNILFFKTIQHYPRVCLLTDGVSLEWSRSMCFKFV